MESEDPVTARIGNFGRWQVRKKIRQTNPFFLDFHSAKYHAHTSKKQVPESPIFLENAETAKFGRERSLIECCNQDVTKPNQRMCCVHGLVYFRLSNITSGWGGKLFLCKIADFCCLHAYTFLSRNFHVAIFALFPPNSYELKSSDRQPSRFLDVCSNSDKTR